MALSAVAGLKPLAGFHEAPSNNFNSLFSLPWAPVSIAVLSVLLVGLFLHRVQE